MRTGGERCAARRAARETWAIDFQEPREPLEGRFSAILGVRDLASRYQLLWQPLTVADGQVVRDALRELFAEHGPPLVLKSDNGSPFTADETEELVSAAQVAPLHSPPRRPRYNGGVERANGTLSQIQEAQAACHSRAGLPTCDDARAALRLANQRCYPAGRLGPTAEQLWRDRPPITAQQRSAFRAAVAAGRALVRQAWNLAPDERLKHTQRSAIDRRAVRDALLAAGLLTIDAKYLRRARALSGTSLTSTLPAERDGVPPTVGGKPCSAISSIPEQPPRPEEAHHSTYFDHR